MDTKKVYEEIKKSLDQKNAELEERREYFKVMVENEISSGCFEQNAINSLLIMSQLRHQIDTLQHWETLLRYTVGTESK